MKGTWAEKILDYHLNLGYNVRLPEGVTFIDPYENRDTQECMRAFYGKYYPDSGERVLMFGINPGRFGAGITGVPFTDPVHLTEVCKIDNPFPKRVELSSSFIYEMISAYGGAEEFYSRYYITSIFPLGFLKDDKNYNYYDSKALQIALIPHIVEHIRAQIAMGGNEEVAYSIGKGTNFKVLASLNREYEFFKEVKPLPHPRWVMQYRLKRKEEFIDKYIEALAPSVRE